MVMSNKISKVCKAMERWYEKWKWCHLTWGNGSKFDGEWKIWVGVEELKRIRQKLEQ